MLLLKLKLGDQVVFTDQETGTRFTAEVDRIKGDCIKLAFDAPLEVRIDRLKLSDRIALEKSLRTPGPIGSTRVASAATLDQRDRFGTSPLAPDASNPHAGGAA